MIHRCGIQINTVSPVHGTYGRLMDCYSLICERTQDEQTVFLFPDPL